MKPAFFVHRYYPVIGGAERYIQKTAEYCVSQKDDVIVHTTDAISLQSFVSRGDKSLKHKIEIINGVKVIRHKIVYPYLRRYWGNLSFKLGILQRSLRGYVHPATPIVPSMQKIKADCDIIVSTAIPYDYINLTAFALSKKAKIPFVFVPFLHLGDLNDPKDPVRYYYTQKYQLNLIRNSDGVIVQTDIEKQYLLDCGVDGNKIAKIGQGIDPKSFVKKDPAVFRKKYNIPQNAFIIGHLGNLSFEKGSLDLLEVFKNLSDKKDIYLVYAGATMDSYKDFVHSMKKHNNFRDLGIIDDNTRDEFFSSIDCFCLPSRVESFGVVFLESWLFEKPVIGYETGGIPGVIDNDKNGFIVKVADIESLTDKILSLYRNSKLRSFFGKDGKRKVEQNFTLDTINRKTYDFLLTIAEK